VKLFAVPLLTFALGFALCVVVKTGFEFEQNAQVESIKTISVATPELNQRFQVVGRAVPGEITSDRERGDKLVVNTGTRQTTLYISRDSVKPER
jgi:hypothetical protein